MSNSDTGGKFAIGFILGIATGLAIGFIFTPRSGEETRELLKRKVVDAGEKVKEFTDDVCGTVKEVTADRKKTYRETWKQPRVKPYTEKL